MSEEASKEQEPKAETADAADADAPTAQAPEPEAPVDPIEALKAAHATEMAEAKDKLLRAMADVENARTRHTREVDEARKYAATGFARDLLDVVDNLGRALAAVPGGARDENKLLDDLMTGVEMTERTLLTAFEKHKINKIEPAKGDRFDHNKHQAMFEVPSGEFAPGSIADVMQPGYTIADRLLRPAMVGVTKAMPKPAVEATEPSDTQPGSQVDTTA